MESKKENIIQKGLRSIRSVLSWISAPAANQTKQNKEDIEIERVTTCTHARAPLRPLNCSPLPGPSSKNEMSINLEKSTKEKHLTKTQNDERTKVKWDIFQDSSDDSFEEKDGESDLQPDAVQSGEKSEPRLEFQDYDTSSTSYSLQEVYTKSIIKDYGVDHLSYLLEKEKRGFVPGISMDKKATCLNWLMLIHGPEYPEVIQATIWYLDAFLDCQAVQEEELLSVATACFWISQKTYTSTRVFPASALASWSDYKFTAVTLLKAQEMVLTKLNFPPQPVVPDDFISSFCCCLEDTSRDEIFTAATFLCMAGKMAKIEICTEFPSVVAAACLKNAIRLLNKTEEMDQLRKSPIYQAAKKKGNMRSMWAALRLAVRKVGCPTCRNNAPVHLYGQSPYFVARKAIAWAYSSAVYYDESSDSDE